MPIKMEWLDDSKRVILWTIEGQWTLDEMHECYSIGDKMCLDVPENTVNALIDLSHSSKIPNNIFSALSTRARTGAPNYDMAVVVSNNSMVKVFASTLNNLPGLRDHFAVVTTREAALAHIEKRRAEREAKMTT